MQYVLLNYQGTFWGALSDLSDDEKKALVAEYGEINEMPDVTTGLPGRASRERNDRASPEREHAGQADRDTRRPGKRDRPPARSVRDDVRAGGCRGDTDPGAVPATRSRRRTDRACLRGRDRGGRRSPTLPRAQPVEGALRPPGREAARKRRGPDRARGRPWQARTLCPPRPDRVHTA